MLVGYLFTLTHEIHFLSLHHDYHVAFQAFFLEELPMLMMSFAL